MARALHTYIPENETRNCVVSGRIPHSLKVELEQIARDEDWSYSDMVTAAMYKFRDDYGHGRPSAPPSEDTERESLLPRKPNFDPETTPNKSSWK